MIRASNFQEYFTCLCLCRRLSVKADGEFFDYKKQHSRAVLGTRSCTVSPTQPLATTGFFDTQITAADVNNTGSMDQVRRSLFIPGQIGSSISVLVFAVVYLTLITFLRLCSILNTQTEPLYEHNHIAPCI